MKHFRILSAAFCFTLMASASHAQKVELSAGVSGNLYSYTGTATDDRVFLLAPTYNKAFRTGWGANVQLEAVLKNGFILGLQTGYDQLNNQQQTDYFVNLAAVDFAPGYGATAPPKRDYSLRQFTSAGTGSVQTELRMLNVNPHLGYRLRHKDLSLDIIAGVEGAYNIRSKVNGTLLNYPYTTAEQKQQADYRLKAGLAVHLNRLSINASYAHGLTNFLSGITYIGPYAQTKYPASAYSQLINLGLSYRIL